MPRRKLPPGLYMVKQRSAEKGVDHYGIADVGNRMGRPELEGQPPVVYHLTPPTIRVDWFEPAHWPTVWGIIDQDGAIERLRAALERPEYNVFDNNCEHFARFVATGRRESVQLRRVVFLSGMTAFGLWAASSEERPRRPRPRRRRRSTRSR